MRFIPNPNTAVRFNPGERPPFELLPKSMADLLTERDRIAGAAAEAVATVRNLNDEALDLAAKQADDDAAAIAARAGKPIPKPVAVAKLIEDRAEAARVLAAQEAAFKAVTQDCVEHVDVVRDDTAEAAAKAKAKARVDIEALAGKLASAVEAAVDAGAVQSWLNMGQFSRDARTWITDAIPDAARYGLHHGNTVHYSAREIILGTALTVLEN